MNGHFVSGESVNETPAADVDNPRRRRGRHRVLDDAWPVSPPSSAAFLPSSVPSVAGVLPSRGPGSDPSLRGLRLRWPPCPRRQTNPSPTWLQARIP